MEHRLGAMNEDEPGLFDLPSMGSADASFDRPSPGKNRETWAWTVTAEVAIIDAEALREAAERAEECAVAIGLSADPTVGDPDVEATADPFDILAWMVWPTDGLEELLEADALRILKVATEVTPELDEACTLSWTVTVKLTDVAELRRIAIHRAHPDKAELIRGSLAVAWQHAADPLAPLRSIPGDRLAAGRGSCPSRSPPSAAWQHRRHHVTTRLARPCRGDGRPWPGDEGRKEAPRIRKRAREPRLEQDQRERGRRPRSRSHAWHRAAFSSERVSVAAQWRSRFPAPPRPGSGSGLLSCRCSTVEFGPSPSSASSSASPKACRMRRFSAAETVKNASCRTKPCTSDATWARPNASRPGCTLRTTSSQVVSSCSLASELLADEVVDQHRGRADLLGTPLRARRRASVLHAASGCSARSASPDPRARVAYGEQVLAPVIWAW